MLGECFTEEHITISFLPLFVIKAFLSARRFLQSACRRAAWRRISKPWPGVGLFPSSGKKPEPDTCVCSRCRALTFSSSQLSAIVVGYINQMMVVVCVTKVYTNTANTIGKAQKLHEHHVDLSSWCKHSFLFFLIPANFTTRNDQPAVCQINTLAN